MHPAASPGGRPVQEVTEVVTEHPWGQTRTHRGQLPRTDPGLAEAHGLQGPAALGAQDGHRSLACASGTSIWRSEPPASPSCAGPGAGESRRQHQQDRDGGCLFPGASVPSTAAAPSPCPSLPAAVSLLRRPLPGVDLAPLCAGPSVVPPRASPVPQTRLCPSPAYRHYLLENTFSGQPRVRDVR